MKRVFALAIFVAAPVPMDVRAQETGERARHNVAAFTEHIGRLAKEYDRFERDLRRLERHLRDDKQERYGQAVNACRDLALDMKFAQSIKILPQGQIRNLEDAYEKGRNRGRHAKIATLIEGPTTGQCRDQRSVLGDSTGDLDEGELRFQLQRMRKDIDQKLDELGTEIVEQKLLKILRSIEWSSRSRSGEDNRIRDLILKQLEH